MPKPLSWNYVALDEYAAPSAPLTEAAHKGLKKLWRRIWTPRRDASAPPNEVQQDVSLFQDLFQAPDWGVASSSLLETVTEGWNAGAKIQIFVGGPHRCTPDMLRSMGQAKGFHLMEAPSPETILSGHFDFPKPDGNSVIVIPQLAHWFLRHDDGLELVRRLLSWIHRSDNPIVIGCHSWGWSFLDKTIQLGASLPAPKVLAPLDAPVLQEWLRSLAKGTRGKKITFREASNGKVALKLDSAEEPSEEDSSSLLTHIASHGRGLPEITWSLWRESVLRFKNEMLEDAALKAVANLDEQTIWVPSWAQLELPELPAKPDHIELFLVHTLLLHSGLPEDVLPLLLPFSKAEIQRTLQNFQTRGLVEKDEDRWRVSVAGYPSVRRTLNDESYLVDSL